MSAKKQQPSKPVAVKKSPKGAVALVWKLASKMPKAERHEVIDACAKAGINPATAKTQYQQWKNATPAQRKAKLEGAKQSTGRSSVREVRAAA